VRNRALELTVDGAENEGIGAQIICRIEETSNLYTAFLSVKPSHPDVTHDVTVLAVSLDGNNKHFPAFN